MEGQHPAVKWSIYILVGAVVGVVAFLIITSIIVSNSRHLATPANINRISGAQDTVLLTNGLSSVKRKGLEERLQTYTEIAPPKALGSDSVESPQPPAKQQAQQIPDGERCLINTPVLSTRLTGYLGPYVNGVFSEADATRAALRSGARCLVLEIDRETNSLEPKLLYRDSLGYVRSLNTGSIQKVAEALATNAFTGYSDAVPSSAANDPFILVLYIVNSPDPNSATRDYLIFLGKIAQQLLPIQQYMMAQTPQGDFRRQRLQRQLFYLPYSIFNKKCITLCNVDTKPFRQLEQYGLKGELGAQQDLDLLVHCRLYARESGFGRTSMPNTTDDPMAYVTTPDFWLLTPPDRLAQAQSQTKSAWTLVMSQKASDEGIPSAEATGKLLNTYGVNSIPVPIFAKSESIAPIVGKGAPFGEYCWSVKSAPMRYRPAAPIPVQKPVPEMNSNGGAVLSPSFSG
jgi:hypothetical protein